MVFQHLVGSLAFARRRLHSTARDNLSRLCLYVQKRNKTAQVNLRLDPALKAAAEKAAASDQRSLTSLVEKLLVDHLRERGYLPTTSSTGA